MSEKIMIVNPLTRRKIQVYKGVYNKLLKEGLIEPYDELSDFDKTELLDIYKKNKHQFKDDMSVEQTQELLKKLLNDSRKKKKVKYELCPIIEESESEEEEDLKEESSDHGGSPVE